MDPFVFTGTPVRVVFERGAFGRIGAEVERLGRSRPLVLATPGRRSHADAIAARLGAPVFGEAAMHTPVAVTERAVAAASSADCLVAVGGGSTIGLSKAIAVRTGLDQVVIPTTYAGSEMTPILGETADGRKTTRRDEAIRPETVIYDVDLTLALPPATSAVSGMNAIAHGVEALYAPDRNPIVTAQAIEGVRALAAGLPVIVDRPGDVAARERALYGAFLCGMVLGATTMALHHKLCHTLGGAFDLPHAETHTVILPHAAAFNGSAVPDLLAPIAEILGAADAGSGLYDLAVRLGAPTRLADLGLKRGALDKAAALATENPYANPRPVTRDGVAALLAAAYDGIRPSGEPDDRVGRAARA